ncbi:DUF5337 domain-containing protein [Halocynthiibacter sp. C4]|uniref:DUF5337 domain-containing protein n=1 Tax=Halocynthiibacter sp. C4 TaxID=2992758 RepID=UPI00237BA70D|nr:DUF5337 domain-containing protein [Halocynthiibacter sp. C4]MDE0589259.1 DUF5337 domain-containing protein [Halocynthiibacter sp. C4]
MTQKGSGPEDKVQVKGRMLALVIAGTAIFWVAAQSLGSMLDWSQRTRLLFDLMAGAGFVWSVVVGYQIWRARQK